MSEQNELPPIDENSGGLPGKTETDDDAETALNSKIADLADAVGGLGSTNIEVELTKEGISGIDEKLDDLNEEGVFEQNDDRGPFISTYLGDRFFINELNVQDIPILTIANALSLNCRFNGHIEGFYSVAEHSVLVSQLVSPENALYGLLHDYAEAFISDIPRPFKSSITGHDDFEAAVMANVCEWFGLPLEIPEDVAYVDRHICAVEATVCAKVVPDWVQYYDLDVCDPSLIKRLDYKQARAAFMNRFNELTGEGRSDKPVVDYPTTARRND